MHSREFAGNHSSHIDRVPSMPPHNLSLIFMGMKEKIIILNLILVDFGFSNSKKLADLPMKMCWIDSKDMKVVNLWGKFTNGGGLTYNLYNFVPLPWSLHNRYYHIVGRNGNNLIIDHKTISYFSLSTSILMSGFTSVTSFVEFSNIPNQKSDVLLIITSQAFKSLTYILLFSYLPWWYLGPVLFIIFMCNVFILHSAKVMKNDLLLFVNALLNVPMLCFFNQSKFSPYSNTNEIGSEENPTVLNTQRSEEQRIEEEGNKDVDKKMIKWTNFILIISFTVTAVLVNFDLICYLKENVLTQYGKNYFNWVR